MTDAHDELLAWVDHGELPRTPLHPCPYLPEQQARQRAFLAEQLDPELYHDLMDRGFRRSGELFYAMDCPSCRACVPLRVPVAEFKPSRSQRRARRRNRDVEVRVCTPEATPESFALYRSYIASQHDAPADDESLESFRASLFAKVVHTVEVRYVLAGRLAAVSLLDVSSRSVSAVYHYYDPALARRSLGVFSVLEEIEWTRAIGVPYYYLGYWIEGARTMCYKANYRPHELLKPGGWRPESP